MRTLKESKWVFWGEGMKERIRFSLFCVSVSWSVDVDVSLSVEVIFNQMLI